jgi:hypothetical protein
LKYNTDINILGSIPNYELIYKALPILVADKSTLDKMLVENNEFNLRTEKSRKRFLSLLNSGFLTDNSELNDFTRNISTFFKDDLKSQSILVFWLFSINNRLFYELNRDVFLKYYFQGRAGIPKDDVIAYIKDAFSKDEEARSKWSEVTIDTTASKYLTILKKLDLVEGVRIKQFKYIRIDDELLAIFIHLYKLIANRKLNIIEDDFLSFSFVSEENILERLKKIAKKDWIKMNFNGVALNVDAAFETKNIIDGIYR